MQMKFNYLILCLLLLLANDIPGCLKNSNDNNNHKGISGFQEINEAINHSVTFNNKFELIIIECKDHLTEGIFLKVTYIFVDIENYNWSVDHADYRELIIVFENNEIESKIKRASIPGPNPPDFGNISLLSNLHGLLDTPGAYT